MPKQIYNKDYNNLDVLPDALVASGYVNGQVLDSSSLSTLITQSNWAGNYSSILTVNTSNLSIPSSTNLTYLFYNITSAIGSTITINMTLNPPAMDAGQTIEIYNNTNVISYFNTQFDSTLIPILPQEIIKIMVLSSNSYLIRNDKESYMQSQIGSYKDIIYNNTSIAGLNARGWYRLDPTTTIGKSTELVSKSNFKRFLVGKICHSNNSKSHLKLYSRADSFLDGDKFYIAYVGLWNNTVNAVSSGRGLSANADWNAGKTISIGGLPGSTLVQSDSSITNFDQNGKSFGEFSVGLIEANNGPHGHLSPTGRVFGTVTANAGEPAGSNGVRGTGSSNKTQDSGSGTPHNNTQPSFAVGRMIRLF